MYAVKYTHNYVHRRRDRTKVVLRYVSTDSSTIGMLKFMHNYIYRSHNRTKIVLNRVSGSEATKSISTIAFARKLMQLNKEEQHIRRWDAALQIENLRAEKLSSKEDNYVDKNLASNNNKVRWTSVKRGFFLDNNYPCLFIYGEIKYLCKNGVLIDFHDMKPIEEEQIITEEGEIKYVVTSEIWETGYILVCITRVNENKNTRSLCTVLRQHRIMYFKCSSKIRFVYFLRFM
ncbi:uncharacterized protein LOC113306937 isoform X3 [Papaver somniferum]|uniref:uncharacterized protein LOC113306937 isoform X3 n=1 Tax=Papaver somniferum TaxID=3469 RepID=UPI000E6F4660|nr:uncharacterized protein LOC113306937 isoform X3 [Papaver somniferum]